MSTEEIYCLYQKGVLKCMVLLMICRKISTIMLVRSLFILKVDLCSSLVLGCFMPMEYRQLECNALGMAIKTIPNGYPWRLYPKYVGFPNFSMHQVSRWSNLILHREMGRGWVVPKKIVSWHVYSIYICAYMHLYTVLPITPQLFHIVI